MSIWRMERRFRPLESTHNVPTTHKLIQNHAADALSQNSLLAKLAVIFSLSFNCAVLFAEDSHLNQLMGSKTEPESCGEKDRNYFPNACGVFDQKTQLWQLATSDCLQLPGDRYQYTHCSGRKMIFPAIAAPEMKGFRLCCRDSTECPGARFVAICQKK